MPNPFWVNAFFIIGSVAGLLLIISLVWILVLLYWARRRLLNMAKIYLWLKQIIRAGKD